MSARSLWNGTIAFGSVAVPVKLFSAVADRTLAFREVRARDGAPIQHRRVGERSGEPVAYAEIEKAYATEAGDVILTREEIAAAEGTHPKVIAIERFVAAEQIDPVFYDRPYLLGAGKDGARAYRVLLAALQRSARVGIGRFVLRRREQLIALRPLRDALAVVTMRFDDELVPPEDLELPALRKRPRARETEMAGKLVEMLSGPWKPEEHHDDYREAVLAMIERKRRGEKLPRVRAPARTDDDLAAALEASLARGSRRGS